MGDCIVENIGGGTPSKANPGYWDGNIPWASVGDLTDETSAIMKTRNHISQLGLASSPSKLVPAGHLIVALKISPGKMRIAGVDMAINQDLRGLKLTAELLPKFVYHYFQTLKLVGNGSIVQGITKSTLEAIPIPVPPIETQKAIADILDNFYVLVNDISCGLPAELDARRKQYDYYRNKLLTFKELEG